MGPFRFLTWWNGLKLCGCEIWDCFKFIQTCVLIFDMAKWSQIMQLQNMGPFQTLSWHGKTVSNFAAAKYGTVSNFVMTWRNGLKFCGCKIWDRFKFCHDMAKPSQIFGCKIWVRFKFCHDVHETAFSFLMWHDAKYFVLTCAIQYEILHTRPIDLNTKVC